MLTPPFGGGELPIQLGDSLLLTQRGGGHYTGGNITLRATPIGPAPKPSPEQDTVEMELYMAVVGSFARRLNNLVEDTVASVAGPGNGDQTGPVRAYLRIDDGEHRVRFDASSWLREAEQKDILDLAQNGWQGGPADQVPWHVVDEPGFEVVQEAMEYDQANSIGFEAYVYGPDALDWLATNRPDVHAAVLAAVDAFDEPVDRPWGDDGRLGTRYATSHAAGNHPGPKR